MLPILTPEESAALDRGSAARGVTTQSLMENAGRAVARGALSLLTTTYGSRAVVVCGKGNNGGDGLVAARYLERWGLGVTAILLAERSSFRDEAAASLRRFEGPGGRMREFTRPRLERELNRADVVVDAIFGTGFRGRPEGDFAQAVGAINASGVPVVAVDVPSGVEGETGAVRGEAVLTELTVTFGALKPGLVFHPGAEHAGDVQVVDIGFPADLIQSDLGLVERSDVAGLLPERDPETHKRTVGAVVIVAGSRAMTGAGILAATSAYRAGAGLVTLAVPEGILPVVESAITEATFLPLPETEDGTISEEAWPVLEERLAQSGAAAVGPGLTTHPSTSAFVRRFVAECPVPFVLDADGLNAFTGQGMLLHGRRAPAVLTPHAGEFARLTGIAAGEVAEDRVGNTRKAAAEFGCTLLLKGSRSVIANPDGRAVVNPTGGPFLATGGTGDVLTGAVAAFLAKKLTTFDAAMLAAYVHGAAGRLAAAEAGEGVMASDVAAWLPIALAALGED
jgi:ADP-dependent NAD(P)H-hydrate dehydratase / NAD(P)H-hydrate epimerase